MIETLDVTKKLFWSINMFGLTKGISYVSDGFLAAYIAVS